MSEPGRYVVGAVALMAIGFALAALAGIRLGVEPGLGLLGGAVTLLLLATRNGHREP